MELLNNIRAKHERTQISKTQVGFSTTDPTLERLLWSLCHQSCLQIAIASAEIATFHF